MNQLILCLPHWKKGVSQAEYEQAIEELTQELLPFQAAVSEIALIPVEGSGQMEFMTKELLHSVRSKKQERHALLLTDDQHLAAFCAQQKIPYAVLLHEGNRNSSFPGGAYCAEELSSLDYDWLNRIYRRAVGLPWEILRTDRLVIREMTPADVPRLYELYADPSVTRYMESLYEDRQQEITYTENYIRNVYAFYGYGMWLITLRETGEVIGRAGLECKEGFDGLELGFMLGAQYQHQGYAYEACSAILDYARKELGETAFRAVVRAGNQASVRLCRQLGFAAEVYEKPSEDAQMEISFVYRTKKQQEAHF